MKKEKEYKDFIPKTYKPRQGETSLVLVTNLLELGHIQKNSAL
jgi:hypothetical protein